MALAKIKLFVAALIFMLSMSFASNANGKNESGSLFVVGSTSMAKLVEVIRQPFYEHTGIKILIRSIGSEKGVVSIGEDVSDIGLISRFLTDKELENWPDLVQVTIGQDAIVFMTNEASTLSNITSEQVVALYTGQEDRLQEQNVTLLSKDKHHATHKMFLQYFELNSMRAPLEKNMLVFKLKGNNQLYGKTKAKAYDQVNQAFANIARIDNALAYESLGAYYVFRKSIQDNKVKLIAFNNIVPIKNKRPNADYPFKRPLNMVIKPNASNTAKALIDFLMSEQGQTILAENYFIPLSG